MAKVKYKTTDKISQEVIDELLSISRHEGLTAQNILHSAENPKNPLHKLFEWDNSKAGVSWRLHQARMLINEIRIVVDQKEMYAFENVQVEIDSSSSRQYKPIGEILSTENYRNQILKSALESLNYWKEKYAELSIPLKPIFVSIDKVNSKWQKQQKQ